MEDVPDLPRFVVLGGVLKDEFKLHGLSVDGPIANHENRRGELFLIAVWSPVLAENWECTRRKAPTT